MGSKRRRHRLLRVGSGMPDFLSNVFEHSGPLALLDLIIVFYLVYVLLLLVRGTRTVPMALGLLLLVILYLVSRYLSLATTYMLLDQLMEIQRKAPRGNKILLRDLIKQARSSSSEAGRSLHAQFREIK